MTTKTQLKEAFESGIDGANSNAYGSVILALKTINPNSTIIVGELLNLLKECSDKWDKETDAYLTKNCEV